MEKGFLYSMHIIAITALLLLPGCKLFVQEEKSAEDTTLERKDLEKAAVEVLTEGISVIDKDELTGDVLVTLKGQPVVTTDSVSKQRELVLEQNPDMKQIFPLFSKQIDQTIAEGLKHQAIMDHYISLKGIDKTAAYQKEIKEGLRGVERAVNIKFFTQSFDIKITDAEVRKFYDENKASIPELMMSRGGIKAMGVQFDSQDAARAFAEKVTEDGDLQKAAQAQNLTDRVRDFGMVNQQTMIAEAPLKNKILSLNKFPSTEVVPVSDTNVWVITATSQEDVTYYPFEQVKTGLKNYLEQKAGKEKFEEEMARLTKEYNVEMNADYFKKSPEGEMAGMEEEMQVDADFDDAADTVAFYEHQQSMV